MEILKAFTQTYQTNKYIQLSSFWLCDTLISIFKDRIYKCRASDPVPNIGLLSRPETGVHHQPDGRNVCAQIEKNRNANEYKP